MENRSFSPLVLAGGILAAGLVGFVAARQTGDGPTAPAATVAEAAAPAATTDEVPPAAGVLEATEAVIEPADAAAEGGAPARASAATATPAATPAPTAARATTARPAPAARTPTRPAAEPQPTRSVPRPATTTTRPPTTPERPAAEPVEVARHEPTWSRPFPAPEATQSLPTRTAPRIDAPPPPPQTRTLTVPADAVVGLQIERAVSSETAAVEDVVNARVTRDVLADGVVVIPAGSRVTGSVTLVDEGGKVRERARLGVRFHTLVLADGTEMRLPTETIYRDGESPSGRSAARIGGGATAGALIGAILGGGKGAAIGAAVGAGGGTAATMAGGRRPATLPAGQSLTVRLSDPVTIEVPR